MLVEVAHHTVDYLESTLKAVLMDYNPDENKQNLIAVHLPEVDDDWLRQVFRYKRPILNKAPDLDYHERINP